MADALETLSQPITVTMLKESTLTLGTLELACAIAHDPAGQVLRLLRQREVAEVVGHIRTPSLVQNIIIRGNFKDYITDGLMQYAQVYTWKSAGYHGTAPKAHRAELLPELCDLYLSARDAGVLHPWQEHIADRCYHIMRSLAKVGIVALVDEATGFQEQRAKDALTQLYDHFLLDLPREWQAMFHKEFWEGAFSLHGRPYHPQHHPRFMMGFVSKAVYGYIPIPLYEGVKERNPVVDEQWRRANKHHPFFTEGPGKELLQKQIERVMAAGWAVEWKQSRREEFWQVLHRICRHGKVVHDAWEAAQRDRGWADTPLFAFHAGAPKALDDKGTL